MSKIRLVLSCGNERIIDSIALDAYGINEGDVGWCPEHDDATIDAMFVDETGDPIRRQPVPR